MEKRRKDFQEAMRLRHAGKTYGEIRTLLNIPKSTLSTWFSDLVLSLDAQKVLARKTREGIKALGKFNQKRTGKIVSENESVRSRYQKMVGSLNRRELMLLGAALYWGEGYKNFSAKRRTYPYMSFSNSDPQMIILFMEFVNRILEIPKSELLGIAMIHPGVDSVKAMSYWQSLSQIPKERFRSYVSLSRASSGIRPKTLLPYGTLQIRANKRQHFFKIRGLIDGIIAGAGV